MLAKGKTLGMSFIGGEWVVGLGAERQNVDPGNLDVMGTYHECTPEQVRAAVDSASDGFVEMRKLSSKDRSKLLKAIADNVEKRFEEMALTVSRDGGKLLADAKYETQRCIQTFTIASEEAKRIEGEVLPMDAWDVPNISNRFGFTRREPIGVVAAVVPFNFPLLMPAHKIAPALAAGNSVVLKPSSDVPYAASKLFECMLDAGVPKKAINLVYGEGSSISEPLIANPKVRMIVFTGSTATGKRIAESAGKEAKKLSFEMGGKNPLIIFDDANMEDALAGALRGGYTHAGQVCIATGRILVQEKIYDEFVKKLAERSAKRKVGYQLDSTAEMGPLINKGRLDAVSAYVEDARNKGAHILCGAKRLTKSEVGHDGFYYSPTVIADVSPDDKIAKEEIFGPVLPVIRFSSLEQAIDIANSLPYGLSSAAYTQSMERAFRCIERIDSGGVSINDPTAIRADQAPFGGFKSSGLGREGLKYAIEEMTEIKMVYWKKY